MKASAKMEHNMCTFFFTFLMREIFEVLKL